MQNLGSSMQHLLFSQYNFKVLMYSFQARGDGSRVTRRIYEFVLQKEERSLRKLQLAADAQKSGGTKRYLRLKKHRLSPWFSETLPLFLPSHINVPYFAFLRQTDLRALALQPSHFCTLNEDFSTVVSVFGFICTSDTQT